jgi:hypothetical protein
MPTTTTAQSSTALSLVRQGVSLQFIGLIWGMIVQDTPYPRLALTAHIQFMAEGAMVLLAGILLHQTSLIEIGAIQSRIVYWGLTGCWVVIAFECVNAFWGTKGILPLVSFAPLYAELYAFVWCGTLTLRYLRLHRWRVQRVL